MRARATIRPGSISAPVAVSALLFLAAALAAPLTPEARADDDARGAPRQVLQARETPGASQWSKPERAQSVMHPSSFVPIANIPIEDVDAVELATPNPSYPDLVVWPTEGSVHFFSAGFGGPAALIASAPTLTPGVTGCDFVADPAGMFGAYQTLGFGYTYDLTGVFPTMVAGLPLPGPVPMRRDIDPIIFADPVSPSGESVIFESGTGLHCRTLPGGAVRWDIYLPSLMVEAVDPAMSPNGHLFAPSVGFMTVIDPVAGAVLSTTTLGSMPVREVDVRFSGVPLGPGAPAAWLPTNPLLHVFDDTPGSMGLPVAGPFGMPGALIEGNDLEWNPSMSIGYLPTLPFMVQVDPAALAPAGFVPLAGFAHQRNQDAVFNDPSMGPAKWVYAMQGTVVIGDDLLFPAPPAFFPSPGVTYDGVDPAFSDTPPFGQIVSIATSAGTNVYNAPALIYMGTIPRTPGAGPLRTDVDAKPGPMAGNYLIQPTVGGLLSVTGFGPNDWVVTVANGIEVVDLAALAVVEFMPYGLLGAPGSMTYRGGDAQPIAFAGGPMEPAFSVDQPDQDFVTKCWEYKFAMNRWPYWYSRTLPWLYPHHLPYGIFGPPPLVGWDMYNRDNVVILANQSLQILSPHGSPIYNIPLPARTIGGLIWDWDNKLCKVRLWGRMEVVVNLTPLGYGQPPLYYFNPYGAYTRWYPIMDRMNGWEFVIRRGGRELWVYDHINPGLVSVFTLPARLIRRPHFDEQRKTLVMPLANRRLCFFNAHAYRIGAPLAQYLYYSPIWPGHLIAEPVFDFYNHYTMLTLRGPRLYLVNNVDGALVWQSGIMPYIPVSPIRIDCYNKMAKGFFRSPAYNYYEMQLNLYPLVFGGIPALTWIGLGGPPYGYPQYDSVDGWELYRLGHNTIIARSLYNPGLYYTAITPYPIIGNLFIDRVNKYLVCALDGPYAFCIDLFRFTNGDLTAAQTVNLPFPPSAKATDDIAFLTQHRTAILHVDVVPGIQTELVQLELTSCTPITYPSLSGLPAINKQIYVHPFSGLVSYPWYDAGLGQGGMVTIDMTPTTWSPASNPQVNVTTLPAPPVDAYDDVPPPGAFSVVQQLPQPGDAGGIVGFDVFGLEPGSTVLAEVTSEPGIEPMVGTADEDGYTEDVAAGLDAPQMICFWEIDPAGNVAGVPECINAIPGAVEGSELPTRIGLALAGANPVRGAARFSVALPASGRVKLAIFDVAGRQVSVLHDAELGAGIHDFTWDPARAGGPAAAGVWFAKLSTPQGDASARFVILP